MEQKPHKVKAEQNIIKTENPAIGIPLEESKIESVASNNESQKMGIGPPGYSLKFLAEIDQKFEEEKDVEKQNQQSIDEVTKDQLLDEFKRFNAKHNLFLQQFSNQEQNIDTIKIH